MDRDGSNDAHQSEYPANLFPPSNPQPQSMDNSNRGTCPSPDDIAGAHQPDPLSVDVNPKAREEAPETADEAAGVIQQNSALAGRKVDMPKRCFIWDHGKEVIIKGKLHWACSRCPFFLGDLECRLTCHRSSGVRICTNASRLAVYGIPSS
jgi:hypothetical protein